MDPASKDVYLHDGEPLGIKPTVKHPGTYFFHSAVGDSEVTVLEPCTWYSYLLSYVDFQAFTKSVLGIADEMRRDLEGKLWNFYYVAWNVDYPYAWVIEREEYEERRGDLFSGQRGEQV